ncbi:hypothetical protein JEQ12_000431 [Ovis aries]|uniref:MHD domain-containing protein n=1 Tax=Ovis aries TaxID=9940 RepID=A0A836AFI5_SHEEP|nr:hypothetical protein JEQ12_000431 [Ovis aries]
MQTRAEYEGAKMQRGPVLTSVLQQQLMTLSSEDSVSEVFRQHIPKTLSKKSNGAPNGFYAEIDWERYGAIKRNLSSEEVARPRRSTPTPELISKKPSEDTTALAPLFGPPLESAFDEQKTEGNDQSATEVKIEKLPSINDLDSIFGPVLSPKSVAVNAEDKWVHFSDTSPERVTPELTPREKPRPFSPPIHSSSPPPIAPLARAESTSSISSTNSLSAATTPTVVSEDDVFYDKLPSFERRCETPAGSSRGPSPLTMGAQDTLPVAAAFTETVNAYFKGADPSNITEIFAFHNCFDLQHVDLGFLSFLSRVVTCQMYCEDYWRNGVVFSCRDHQTLCQQSIASCSDFSGDKFQQVSAQGIQSTPLNLAVNWRCEPASTDLRIDYKYNTDAMATAVALNNVQFLVPVDGGVTKLQAVLPPAVWNADQQRILWKIPDISQKSENGGVGSLLARFQLSEGPSKPSPLVVQFTSEGSTLSGCDIELVGAGYRFSLIKKRFAAVHFASVYPDVDYTGVLDCVLVSSTHFNCHLFEGPTKHFPVVIVNHILKDVLTTYLQEEQYEPELCRQMTKTISEVIKAQVKDLMIPRYKLIVIVHIGQLTGQSILIGSRCLWDPKNDAFASFVFRNSSLFALANVYTVYFE